MGRYGERALEPDGQQMRDEQPEAEEADGDRGHDAAEPRVVRVRRQREHRDERLLRELEAGVSTEADKCHLA
jgi:hypothetical protein